MTDIAKLFAKDPMELTPDDIDKIVAAYQEYMPLLRANGPKSVDPKTGEQKKRRRKAKIDPRQIDLEELLAKEEKDK